MYGDAYHSTMGQRVQRDETDAALAHSFGKHIAGARGSAPAQGVYKTTVTVEVGYSVQDQRTGDWVKPVVSIATEVGPGYPSPAMLGQLLRQQLSDAVSGCDDAIERMAQAVVEETRRK